MAEFLRRTMKEFQCVTAPFRQNTRRHLKVGCFENLDFGSLLFRARDSLFDLYPEISLQLHAYPNYSDLFRRLEERVIDLAIMPTGNENSSSFCLQNSDARRDLRVYLTKIPKLESGSYSNGPERQRNFCRTGKQCNLEIFAGLFYRMGKQAEVAA